jgi:hypothetical protein
MTCVLVKIYQINVYFDWKMTLYSCCLTSLTLLIFFYFIACIIVQTLLQQYFMIFCVY